VLTAVLCALLASAGAGYGQVAVPGAGGQNGAPALPSRMGAILAHPSLAGASVGMLVVDAESGEPLLQRNADELFAPASVTKLFTAATALWRLGAAFTWQTPLAYRGEIRGADGEIIGGDLWALGRGAPDTVEEQLWMAARALYTRGIRGIEGDIVVDDSYFDRQRYGEGWPGGIQVKEAYHAPIGALMANYSAYRDGDDWVAVQEPDLYFGERLHELLGLAGVMVTGTVRRPTEAEAALLGAVEEIDAGNSRIGVPEELTLLYTIHSEPLGRLVLDLNKFSNNVMAENMLKTLGAVEYGPPGTATKGLAVVAKFRHEVLGTELTDYVQADGSGLSDLDRVTPRQVVDLLQFAYNDFHLGPEFIASMKISGRDGFNPRPFRDPPLLDEMRLKSGHISGVNTLSGYAHTDSGKVVAFCLMINGHHAQQWEIDQRVAELSQVILSSY
jgi:D-alanyl-D-alanine carboxypeptidase/D-alanyl-D-alanine-endopeptidase (penicillin-binding protein 4)